MPFIGNQPALSYTSFAKQDFTTSATTSYTLDNPVANENEIALFINFVRQEPTTAYTASGTSLTLTSATSASDDMYCVFLGKAVQTVNPPNGSVGASQIADSSIALGKLSATGTKDSTTFLRGDNTFASAGGDLTPAFSAYQGTTTVLSDASLTTIKFDTENFDTDSAFDTSNYTFTVPSGEGGEYYFSVRMEVEAGAPGRYDNFYIRLRKNGSTTLKEIHYYPGNATYSPRTFTWELNCTATLVAGDAITVAVYMDFTAGAPQIQAYQSSSEFAGFKILGA